MPDLKNNTKCADRMGVCVRSGQAWASIILNIIGMHA